MVIFECLTLKLVLNSFQTFAKMYFILFYYVGGWKMIKDFRKTEKFKNIKNGQFSFFDILQLPHTVISNSEKLTHPIA